MIIFTIVVSNKNTDFQFYIFLGWVKFNNNIYYVILGYERKKDTFG